jgi:hypothetical protein
LLFSIALHDLLPQKFIQVIISFGKQEKYKRDKPIVKSQVSDLNQTDAETDSQTNASPATLNFSRRINLTTNK